MEEEPKYNYHKLGDSGQHETKEKIIDTEESPPTAMKEGVNHAESEG